MADIKQNRIEIFLDENKESIASYVPPAKFDLDTSELEDGEHTLIIVAYGDDEKRSIRKIKFFVRNGPGIAIQGLRENDVVEGKISLLVNAYGGSTAEKWEPTTAETPAAIPSWIWIMFILITAWAIFYFINEWKPTEEFANTPTYRNLQMPVEKKVVVNETATNGADLYRKSCSSCHQENGQGLTNVFPPLMSDDVINSDKTDQHIKIVLFGLEGKVINGVKYATPMPSWESQLSDEEIAAVINHERSSWGNKGKLVSPEEVSKIRAGGK